MSLGFWSPCGCHYCPWLNCICSPGLSRSGRRLFFFLSFVFFFFPLPSLSLSLSLPLVLLLVCEEGDQHRRRHHHHSLRRRRNQPSQSSGLMPAHHSLLWRTNDSGQSLLISINRKCCVNNAAKISPIVNFQEEKVN